MGSIRVGHDWVTSLSLFTFMTRRRKWQPTPVFLPGESQGRGSLVGCRLWGRRVGHDWATYQQQQQCNGSQSIAWGIFICPTFLFPLSTCAGGGWILFRRNSLWLLAGQYLASGFIVRGLTKCSLCPEGGSSQNGCCLMLFHISSTCSSAKSILVDRGKRMSSFMFLRTWSSFYHLVAGEENRNSSLGSRILQSHC